jgi:hypothetical protein
VIRFQIIERSGAHLHRTLLDAMRSGALQTFSTTKRGRKVSHAKYPGWMNWSVSDGVITCEVLSPRKPRDEWKLLHAFLGRLADRFGQSIVAINIQFPLPEPSGSVARIRRRPAGKALKRSAGRA